MMSKNIGRELINLQFKVAGHRLDYDTLVKDYQFEHPKWYSELTITKDKAHKFKVKAILKIQKFLRCSKKKAEYEFAMWNLCYGLREVS